MTDPRKSKGKRRQLATVLTLIALTKWEQGKHRPSRENRARIIRLLGHERL